MSKLLLSYHIFIFVLLSSSLHTACTNGNSEPLQHQLNKMPHQIKENYGDQTDDQNSITVYENLELIWNDEFDYDGRPDESKWHHQTFAPNGGSWFNEELQHYVNNEQTTYVDNGSLKIVARNKITLPKTLPKIILLPDLTQKEVFNMDVWMFGQSFRKGKELGQPFGPLVLTSMKRGIIMEINTVAWGGPLVEKSTLWNKTVGIKTRAMVISTGETPNRVIT